MDNNTLSLYYTFTVVAASKSISAASEELFVSQPAVSKSIKKLESILNTTLFNRSSQGIKLTAEGEELYSYLTKAFNTIASGEASLKHINKFGIGKISIGISSTLCKYLLIPKISDFTKTHPHVQISIKCQPSSDTLKALKNNDIDFGIVVGTTEKFEAIHFDELSDVFVATPEYVKNLIARDNVSADNILENSNLILLNRANATRQYIEQYLTKWHLTPINPMELNSMELLIDFAKAGLGVGATIQRFVENELKSNELILIKTPEALKKRTVSIVYESNANLSKNTKELIEYILN